MGWWWSSTNTPATTSSTTTITTTTSSAPPPDFPIVPTNTTTASISSTGSAREASSQQPQNNGLTPALPSPASNPSNPIQPTSDPSNEPLPDPTIPENLSCRILFDSAFYCSSFGGHFNDIYRFGHLRSCSEHWADWRFCMSLKSRGKEATQELIRERWAGKEEERRKKGCSEDVWRVRTQAEEVKQPFSRAHEMDE